MTAKLGKAWTTAAAGFTLLKLYMLPSKANDLPGRVRLAPTW
jgi:hypothetical protein